MYGLKIRRFKGFKALASIYILKSLESPLNEIHQRREHPSTFQMLK